LFNEVKNNLKIRQVVEFYGVKLSNNKAFCPFHNEKNKSFSISDSKQIFRCHTCSDKAGDLISFVSRLYNLKPIDACKKLNEDFLLGLSGKLTKAQKLKSKRQATIMLKAKKDYEAKRQEYFDLYSMFGEFDKICIENKPNKGDEVNNLWIVANELREYYWDKILGLELI